MAHRGEIIVCTGRGDTIPKEGMPCKKPGYLLGDRFSFAVHKIGLGTF